MDKETLRQRLMVMVEGIVENWEAFGPKSRAPVLRMRYGEHVLVVGVEFALQHDDARSDEVAIADPGEDVNTRIGKSRGDLARFAAIKAELLDLQKQIATPDDMALYSMGNRALLTELLEVDPAAYREVEAALEKRALEVTAATERRRPS